MRIRRVVRVLDDPIVQYFAANTRRISSILKTTLSSVHSGCGRIDLLALLVHLGGEAETALAETRLHASLMLAFSPANVLNNFLGLIRSLSCDTAAAGVISPRHSTIHSFEFVRGKEKKEKKLT